MLKIIICRFKKIKLLPNWFLPVLAGAVVAGVFCASAYVFAVYQPGETLTPTCAPGDAGCTVAPPLANSFTTDFSGSGDLTTTGSFHVKNNNTYQYFGALDQAKIYFNGTNLVVDPGGSGTNIFSLGSAIKSSYVMKFNTGSGGVTSSAGSLTYSNSDARVSNTPTFDFGVGNRLVVSGLSFQDAEGSILYTLPTTAGSANKVLGYDAEGALGWQTASSGFSAGASVTDGTNTLAVADGTYAINATGTSLFTEGTTTTYLNNGTNGVYSSYGSYLAYLANPDSAAFFNGGAGGAVTLSGDTYAIDAAGDINTTGAYKVNGTAIQTFNAGASVTDGTNTLAVADGTYAINATGDNQFTGGTSNFYDTDQFYNVILGGSPYVVDAAGISRFINGGAEVDLVDGTYAINATGTSLFTEGTTTTYLNNGTNGVYSSYGSYLAYLANPDSAAFFNGGAGGAVTLSGDTYAIDAAGDINTTGAYKVNGTAIQTFNAGASVTDETNTLAVADGNYPINATGYSYFQGLDGTPAGNFHNGPSEARGQFYAMLGRWDSNDSTGYGGLFSDGSRQVFLSDGTYAINATGNALISGDIRSKHPSFGGDARLHLKQVTDGSAFLSYNAVDTNVVDDATTPSWAMVMGGTSFNPSWFMIQNEAAGSGWSNPITPFGVNESGRVIMQGLGAAFPPADDTVSTVQIYGDSASTNALYVDGSSSTYAINATGAINFAGSITASSGTATATTIAQTLVAAANDDVLNAVVINPTFTDGDYTGVVHNPLTIKSLGQSSGTNLVVDSDGIVYKASSSLRYKENVQDMAGNFAKILQAKPKSFTYKDTNVSDIGYIAEDFDAMGLNDLVIYDKRKQPDGIKYDRVAIYLAEVVKQQQLDIQAMQQKLGITAGNVAVTPAGTVGSGEVSGVAPSSITGALSSLGISISNGATSIASLATKTFTSDSATIKTARVNSLEMVAANGEVYCTWINGSGNWEKAKGNCADVDITATSASASNDQATTQQAAQALGNVAQSAQQVVENAQNLVEQATNIVVQNATPKVVDQATPEVVNQAAQQVVMQVNEAVADKSSLESAIQSAQSKIEANYTADSWAVLQEALEAAQAVQAESSAAQADINTATTNINSAMSGLLPVEPEESPSTGDVIQNAAGSFLNATWRFIKWMFNSVYESITSSSVVQKLSASVLQSSQNLGLLEPIKSRLGK